jgi:hypothetical protein
MEGTDRDVGVLNEKHISVDNGGQTGQASHQPNDNASDFGYKHCATEAGLHWVNNGQVAIDAETGEQKDTGVEVETDAGGGDLAQVIAKGPAVFHCSVDSPQWQSQKKA